MKRKVKKIQGFFRKTLNNLVKNKSIKNRNISEVGNFWIIEVVFFLKMLTFFCKKNSDSFFRMRLLIKYCFSLLTVMPKKKRPKKIYSLFHLLEKGLIYDMEKFFQKNRNKNLMDFHQFQSDLLWPNRIIYGKISYVVKQYALICNFYGPSKKIFKIDLNNLRPPFLKDRFVLKNPNIFERLIFIQFIKDLIFQYPNVKHIGREMTLELLSFSLKSDYLFPYMPIHTILKTGQFKKKIIFGNFSSQNRLFRGILRKLNLILYDLSLLINEKAVFILSAFLIFPSISDIGLKIKHIISCDWFKKIPSTVNLSKAFKLGKKIILNLLQQNYIKKKEYFSVIKVGPIVKYKLFLAIESSNQMIISKFLIRDLDYWKNNQGYLAFFRNFANRFKFFFWDVNFEMLRKIFILFFGRFYNAKLNKRIYSSQISFSLNKDSIIELYNNISTYPNPQENFFGYFSKFGSLIMNAGYGIFTEISNNFNFFLSIGGSNLPFACILTKRIRKFPMFISGIYYNVLFLTLFLIEKIEKKSIKYLMLKKNYTIAYPSLKTYAFLENIQLLFFKKFSKIIFSRKIIPHFLEKSVVIFNLDRLYFNLSFRKIKIWYNSLFFQVKFLVDWITIELGSFLFLSQRFILMKNFAKRESRRKKLKNISFLKKLILRREIIYSNKNVKDFHFQASNIGRYEKINFFFSCGFFNFSEMYLRKSLSKQHHSSTLNLNPIFNSDVVNHGFHLGKRTKYILFRINLKIISLIVDPNMINWLRNLIFFSSQILVKHLKDYDQIAIDIFRDYFSTNIIQEETKTGNKNGSNTSLERIKELILKGKLADYSYSEFIKSFKNQVLLLFLGYNFSFQTQYDSEGLFFLDSMITRHLIFYSYQFVLYFYYELIIRKKGQIFKSLIRKFCRDSN
mmetsp:Transcript_58/g.77  ORF Transcript_58/g.77 Transcript_58/m.77 type:complete len:903 (+) Transcript_58:903-3611(+)